LALLAASLAGAAFAESAPPPALIWTREFFTDGSDGKFRCALQSESGGFLVAGYSWIVGEPMTGSVFKYSESGSVEWSWQPDFYASSGNWVEELPGGAIIVCGLGMPVESSSAGIMLARLTASGQTDWVRCYPAPSSDGYCAIQLPDEGYAVCGAINSYDSWLIRTDADGDILWTRVWDSGSWDRARRVIYYNNGLTVYVAGNGPWIVRYDMNGNLQWVADYSGEVPAGDFGGSMCLASDYGYAMATGDESWLIHTFWSGQEEWREQIQGTSGRLGLSLDPTMDGGYIFSGWGGYWGPPETIGMHSAEVDTGYTNDGWLAKLDDLGQTQWVVYNSQESRSNYFNCARQLSQGGYIVAGQIEDEVHSDWNGYLLRYAPETGIEEGPPTPGEVLSLWSCGPNPSSSSFIVSWSSGIPGGTTVRVHDISGRLRMEQDLGALPEGEHTTQVDLQQLPSGCYLVVVSCGSERASTKLVVLR
jgi:hypothetical protein